MHLIFVPLIKRTMCIGSAYVHTQENIFPCTLMYNVHKVYTEQTNKYSQSTLVKQIIERILHCTQVFKLLNILGEGLTKLSTILGGGGDEVIARYMYLHKNIAPSVDQKLYEKILPQYEIHLFKVCFVFIGKAKILYKVVPSKEF